MAKRFIISEEERNDIRLRYGLLNEQNETLQQKKAVQCFLNKLGFKDDSNQPLKVDGLWGEKTEEALKKYQTKIGANVDGHWGFNTASKMSEKDNEVFEQCISDEGDIIDKGLHYLKKWF